MNTKRQQIAVSLDKQTGIRNAKKKPIEKKELLISVLANLVWAG